MKALLLTCGLIVIIVSVLIILYNHIASDYEDKSPDYVLDGLTFVLLVVGIGLSISAADGRFTGVHDTRSDVYIITEIEERFETGQFIAKYKAKSYDTENRLNQTGVDIQFYDALQKFHVGDTLKFGK